MFDTTTSVRFWLITLCSAEAASVISPPPGNSNTKMNDCTLLPHYNCFGFPRVFLSFRSQFVIQTVVAHFGLTNFFGNFMFLSYVINSTPEIHSQLDKSKPKTNFSFQFTEISLSSSQKFQIPVHRNFSFQPSKQPVCRINRGRRCKASLSRAPSDLGFPKCPTKNIRYCFRHLPKNFRENHENEIDQKWSVHVQTQLNWRK